MIVNAGRGLRSLFLLSLLVFSGAFLPLPAFAAWSDEIIYFIMVDRFANGDTSNDQDVDPDNPLAFQGGDLRGIIQNIDEIADLGATAIWITPIAKQVEHPIDAAEGKFFPHHGYWTDDFYAIDPRYGTEADLNELVETAHELNIKVLLDVVYNHVGYGSRFETDAKFRKWLRLGDECGGDPLTLCLAGLPDLRTENAEVRRYLFDAQLGLAERTGIDGFRLDTVKHISHDFWRQHREEARELLGEDFFLLGEVWDADKFLAKPYLDADEMDAMLDFGFRDRVLKFLQGTKDAASLSRYLVKRHDVAKGHWLAPFLSNHDVPMMLALVRGDVTKLKIGLTLLMTAEGPPVLSWGEELGRKGGLWPDNRTVMPWGERDVAPGEGLARDEDLRIFVKNLIEIRKNYSDLRSREIEILSADRDSFIMQRGECLIVAVNRGTEPFDIGKLQFGGLKRLSPDTAENISITTIPALSAVIFDRKECS